MKAELQTKTEKLHAILRSLGKVAVAFSGGVDSSLLLYEAHRILGDNALGITIITPYIPQWEIEEAKAFTHHYGIRHELVELPFPPQIRANPENRCYLCKTILFNRLLAISADRGMTLTEGTNQDDLGDYRPGLRALKELGVKSPLLDAGFTKNDIRQLSEIRQLPTSDKPAYACLMTRIPFDTPVTEEILRRIELAEKALFELGFKAVRVRHHGELARVELPPEKIAAAATPPLREKIVAAISAAGYRFVTIDLAGYHMGSFNAR